MPSPLLRRSIWALGLAVLLVVAAAVALPYFASTRIVRDRIAEEIGAWSGFVVSIGGNPQITVWPRFQAVLTDVSMTRPDEPGEPVLATERMEISLSAFAALAGNVEFSTARLVRPTLRVRLPPTACRLPPCRAAAASASRWRLPAARRRGPADAQYRAAAG